MRTYILYKLCGIPHDMPACFGVAKIYPVLQPVASAIVMHM